MSKPVIVPSREGFIEFDSVSTQKNLRLSYACYGKASGEPLVLIMGLAMQRTSWPSSWLQAFVDSGFYVITFDNRDVGLSTRMDDTFTPTPIQLVMRRMFGMGKLAYQLSDMADDTYQLLQALNIQQASILGVSMGGMIAQRLALKHPHVVSDLTLTMTSSGSPWLPIPRLDVLRYMASRPSGSDARQAAENYLVGLFQLIGSPGFPVSEPERRNRARIQVNRSVAGNGMLRQLAAIQADTQRCHELAKLKMPVQVLHGDGDPLLPVPHAHDLAERIPGAKLRIVPGLGHDLPDALAEFFAKRVLELSST